MESNFIIISSSHFETGVEWQKQKPFSFSSIFPRLNLWSSLAKIVYFQPGFNLMEYLVVVEWTEQIQKGSGGFWTQFHCKIFVYFFSELAWSKIQ